MSRRLLPLLALAAALPACAPDDLVYEVRGVYHGPASTQGAVSITHEAIPNVMEAMTMDFAVGDTAGLGALHPGDPVRFRFVVPEGGPSRAEGFERLPAGTPLALPAAPPASPAASPTAPADSLAPARPSPSVPADTAALLPDTVAARLGR